MKKAARILLLAGLVFSLNACKQHDESSHDTYLVLVSFDGFRWDYSDMYETPAFDELARQGVKAERLIPSFPTKTFPNHYTLATGLYPDHHGIINNSFYAPDLDEIYRIGNKEMVTNPDAYFGEPIWVTAEQQGIRSACYFWVGSEAAIMETPPTYWNQYDGSIPYVERVDQVIEWLERPLDKRPGLITLYFSEPDGIGHEYGPVHEETAAVVNYNDSILGYLRSEIEKLPYGEKVNLVVLSDHGMGPISADRYVNLNDYIKEEWAVSVIGGNPLYLVEPETGFTDSITLALNQVEGVSAWQKDEIPARLHYGSSPRFPGIVVVADSLWSIGTRDNASGYSGGTHGYDNAYTAMHTIFYASGPAFKENYISAPFSNVEVYGIIAHVLGLDPAETDGDLSHVQDIFSTK